MLVPLLKDNSLLYNLLLSKESILGISNWDHYIYANINEEKEYCHIEIQYIRSLVPIIKDA